MSAGLGTGCAVPNSRGPGIADAVCDFRDMAVLVGALCCVDHRCCTHRAASRKGPQQRFLREFYLEGGREGGNPSQSLPHLLFGSQNDVMEGDVCSQGIAMDPSLTW